ncbi:MAG: hypothetical protein A2X86_05895 [Bdellovibrionales bacterium GWA2_49_15]|nr:MAG: hypothetical protein A2X86_05895 [Bdellovibrionales bacterium GWA2_49_15]
MLTLEFSASPDESILGDYVTYKKSILIGRSRTADIVILDKKILKVELSIHLQRAGIMVESKNVNGFLTNKKKILGGKIHHVGDEIHIGDTCFKFKAYQPPQFFNYTEEIAYKIEETIKKDAKYEEVFYFLEKELLSLEKESSLEK